MDQMRGVMCAGSRDFPAHSDVKRVTAVVPAKTRRKDRRHALARWVLLVGYMSIPKPFATARYMDKYFNGFIVM